MALDPLAFMDSKLKSLPLEEANWLTTDDNPEMNLESFETPVSQSRRDIDIEDHEMQLGSQKLMQGCDKDTTWLTEGVTTADEYFLRSRGFVEVLSPYSSNPGEESLKGHVGQTSGGVGAMKELLPTSEASSSQPPATSCSSPQTGTHYLDIQNSYSPLAQVKDPDLGADLPQRQESSTGMGLGGEAGLSRREVLPGQEVEDAMPTLHGATTEQTLPTPCHGVSDPADTGTAGDLLGNKTPGKSPAVCGMQTPPGMFDLVMGEPSGSLLLSAHGHEEMHSSTLRMLEISDGLALYKDAPEDEVDRVEVGLVTNDCDGPHERSMPEVMVRHHGAVAPHAATSPTTANQESPSLGHGLCAERMSEGGVYMVGTDEKGEGQGIRFTGLEQEEVGVPIGPLAGGAGVRAMMVTRVEVSLPLTGACTQQETIPYFLGQDVIVPKLSSYVAEPQTSSDATALAAVSPLIDHTAGSEIEFDSSLSALTEYKGDGNTTYEVVDHVESWGVDTDDEQSVLDGPAAIMVTESSASNLVINDADEKQSDILAEAARKFQESPDSFSAISFQESGVLGPVLKTTARGPRPLPAAADAIRTLSRGSLEGEAAEPEALVDLEDVAVAPLKEAVYPTDHQDTESAARASIMSLCGSSRDCRTLSSVDVWGEERRGPLLVGSQAPSSGPPSSSALRLPSETEGVVVNVHASKKNDAQKMENPVCHTGQPVRALEPQQSAKRSWLSLTCCFSASRVHEGR